MAPKWLSFEAAVNAFHHPIVCVEALDIEAQFDASARAFVLVGTGVQHLEGLAHQLLACGAKHLAHVLVAVHHGAVARQHQPDGREVKGLAVINHGEGFKGSVLTKNYVVEYVVS